MLINPFLLPLEEQPPLLGLTCAGPSYVIACPAHRSKQIVQDKPPQCQPKVLVTCCVPATGAQHSQPRARVWFKLRSVGLLPVRGTRAWAGGVAQAGGGEDRTFPVLLSSSPVVPVLRCRVKFPVQCRALLTRGNRSTAPPLPLTGSAGFWHLVTVPPILHGEEKSLYFPLGWCRTMRGNTPSVWGVLPCSWALLSTLTLSLHWKINF